MKKLHLTLFHLFSTFLVIIAANYTINYLILLNFEDKNENFFSALGNAIEASNTSIVYNYFVLTVILFIAITLGKKSQTKFDDIQENESSRALKISSGILIWMLILFVIFGGALVIKVTR